MKKIRVDHLSRVEGHGAITVEIEGKKVKDVKFEILEGPRLFETLTIGKLPEENVSVVPRICAICTLSHKNASLRGVEKCLGIEVPQKVALMRELMMLGENVESNALHVYLLALPDILGYPNAIAMVDKYAEAVTEGLTLKKFGNRIMEITAARATHGENPIIGGFGRYPSKEDLLELKDTAIKLLPAANKVVELLGPMDFKYSEDEKTTFACVNPPKNEFGYVADSIILSDGKVFDAEEYTKVTNEKIVPHSYAKRSSYKGAPYTVGAIARMNNLGDRLKGQAGKYYKKFSNDRWLTNPLYNNVAQAIELVYDLELLPGLVDKILKLKDPEIVKPNRQTGKGTGAVEAPRGTLYHSYEIKDGRMSKVDIITPTAQNLDDSERYLRKTAQKMLEKGKKDDEIKRHMEIIARAYDPCISCSAHLVKLVRR
ncbi:MAG TPA: Ni/Fe hydrogenase subunit alpha [Euryarchaeota archaeon]|nr:Ni/Fe hydrogenase subunit alpha [Euryarchaeota archaeon]